MTMMKQVLVTAAFCLLSAMSTEAQQVKDAELAAAYKDSSLPVAKRVEDLLRRMSLEEKIEQLHQDRHNEILEQGMSDEALERFFQRHSRGGVSVFHGYPCLKLEMADSHYPLSVVQFIRVIPELDVYEKWLEVRNTGTENIKLERIDSGSLLLPPGSYDLHHLAGDWGREFLPQSTRGTRSQRDVFDQRRSSQGHCFRKGPDEQRHRRRPARQLFQPRHRD